MCPTARSRRDVHNEHVKIGKWCKIGLETPKVRMSLRNEHFQNAARGPLKYVGPGPSAPHFENVHCLSWCIHMTILGSLEADLMTLFKFNMLITEISARSSCWTCCFEYSCPSGHARITYSCSDYVFMLGLRIATDWVSGPDCGLRIVFAWVSICKWSALKELYIYIYIYMVRGS